MINTNNAIWNNNITTASNIFYKRASFHYKVTIYHFKFLQLTTNT